MYENTDYQLSRTELKELRTKEDKMRMARANERARIKLNGTMPEIDAVKLAESGYGYEDIQRLVGISEQQAKLIVLGVLS